MVRRETGLQGGVLLSKPAIHHRRFIVTGGVTALAWLPRWPGYAVCRRGADTADHRVITTRSTKHGVKRLVTGLISGSAQGGVAAEGW
jgi:hypothetical protein